MQISTINNFIKKNLVKKIRSDSKASKRIIPKITNERDLESAIYYHLRKKLKKELDLKISTNYTFSGVKKRHQTTFVQPDIVISQWIDDFHPKFIENPESAHSQSRGYPKMLIAFELKSQQPGDATSREKNYYENLFKKKGMQKDFQKLNSALYKEYIKFGYFFYLYHDIDVSESDMKKIIEKSIKRKRRFDIIVINRFNIPSDTKTALETRQKLRQNGRFYVEKDHRKIWEICEKCGKFVQEHTEKQDKICFPDKKNRRKTKSKSNRSAVAKKAARTRKRNAQKAKAKRSAVAKKAARTRKRNAQKRKSRSKYT